MLKGKRFTRRRRCRSSTKGQRMGASSIPSRVRPKLRPKVARLSARRAYSLLGTSPHPPKPADWYRYRNERRRGGGVRGSLRGHGFRLTFARPVPGAICDRLLCAPRPRAVCGDRVAWGHASHWREAATIFSQGLDAGQTEPSGRIEASAYFRYRGSCWSSSLRSRSWLSAAFVIFLYLCFQEQHNAAG